jgi:hypothetical protein
MIRTARYQEGDNGHLGTRELDFERYYQIEHLGQGNLNFWETDVHVLEIISAV